MADLGIHKGGFQFKGGHIHCIGGGRMLQLGVLNIYGGCSKCAKHTKHANSKGIWGHTPGKI